MAIGSGTANGVPVLTVYARSYCHLCDDMIAQLQALQTACSVNVIDIDSDPALEARYGELVPVLMADDRELCHYHLDLDSLRAFFAEKREKR